MKWRNKDQRKKEKTDPITIACSGNLVSNRNGSNADVRIEKYDEALIRSKSSKIKNKLDLKEERRTSKHRKISQLQNENEIKMFGNRFY